MRPISGATINDLDRRRLKDYFGRVRQQDVPGDDDSAPAVSNQMVRGVQNAGWQTLLVNTEIMVEEGVTLSGLLLFGKAPNRYLPQAGIDAAAFPGIEKDYAAKERTALRGPMTPLMDGDGTVLEAGLVEQALEFVRRNTPVTAVLKEGGRRVERPTYPVEVIREAVVNALIHRDYLLVNTDIELAIYEDRLEITSPGKLPNGITPGAHACRNEGRAKPAPEGRDARLRISGTHGHGHSQKNY